ncbi:hypothetical protein GEMRC1_011425 [Eukaryota sp. GEM-RC1]
MSSQFISFVGKPTAILLSKRVFADLFQLPSVSSVTRYHSDTPLLFPLTSSPSIDSLYIVTVNEEDQTVLKYVPYDEDNVIYATVTHYSSIKRHIVIHFTPIFDRSYSDVDFPDVDFSSTYFYLLDTLPAPDDVICLKIDSNGHLQSVLFPSMSFSYPPITRDRANTGLLFNK